MAREGYIPKTQRKKILFLCDDLRMHSGIATMAREIVFQTCHKYNWVNLGAAISHPEKNTVIDVSADLAKNTGVEDPQTIIYPIDGYGSPDIIRALISREDPDAIMFFTDPRYWTWLFQMENEVRKKIPMVYLNIWDDLPAPLYNRSYYESCDALLAISKQTLNINKLVLGDRGKDKVFKYVPHGINSDMFYPIDKTSSEEDQKRVMEFKSKLFGKKDYKFVVFYNSRNIRRKCTSDLIAAYSLFCDKIGKEKAKECVLLLHTDAIDENGTNLLAVRELLCDPEYVNVEFTSTKFPPNDMKYLYNLTDVTVLPSSNEGWGLSLTESMMCGRMIIANVTGGMQDQMRFVDENGDWIEFSEDFCSNHFGTYKECGEWAVPVFPSNMSIVGSLPTPYIWDDRLDFRDLTDAIEKVYNLSPEERQKKGLAGRKWVTSDEAMMSGEAMGKNVIEAIEETFKVWKPRKDFEFIKIEKLPANKLVHKLVY